MWEKAITLYPGIAQSHRRGGSLVGKRWKFRREKERNSPGKHLWAPVFGHKVNTFRNNNKKNLAGVRRNRELNVIFELNLFCQLFGQLSAKIP